MYKKYCRTRVTSIPSARIIFMETKFVVLHTRELLNYISLSLWRGFLEIVILALFYLDLLHLKNGNLYDEMKITFFAVVRVLRSPCANHCTKHQTLEMFRFPLKHKGSQSSVRQKNGCKSWGIILTLHEQAHGEEGGAACVCTLDCGGLPQ